MTVRAVTLGTLGTVDITFAEVGEGHPTLLLHGGAGPLSVAGFARLLADRYPTRVYVPSHPGFGGTVRPEWLTNPGQLAAVYLQLVDDLDLRDVTVIGNSIGGWIAAEIALLDRSRLRNLVLIDAGGIVVEGHPGADVFSLAPAELLKLSFHDPARFAIDPSTMTEPQKAGMAANRAALAVYGGRPHTVDPSLAGRLHDADLPALVLWGASDRIFDADYGRAFAAALPRGRFQLLPNAGHVPFLETPEQVVDAVREYVQ
jgi:pimeloyl-ACP methyl ester carboxylesterase